MSNIGTKIEKLLNEGFSYNTLRGLSEAQVNLLYKRLIEQAAPPNTKPITKTTYEVQPNKKTVVGGMEIDTTGGKTKVTPLGEDETLNVVDDPDATEDGMGMFEGEMTEKFESKRQQKYFWWKCSSSKSEKAKKKWCKWAEEFSKKTDFEKLPEKKLEEGLTKLIEKYIPESITKKDLMGLIESAAQPKEAPTKPKTTPKKPGERNPFKKPGALPNIKAGAQPKEAPTKPTTRPGTKPKSPGERNPFKKPGALPNPRAGRAPEWLSYKTFVSQGYSI